MIERPEAQLSIFSTWERNVMIWSIAFKSLLRLSDSNSVFMLPTDMHGILGNESY